MKQKANKKQENNKRLQKIIFIAIILASIISFSLSFIWWKGTKNSDLNVQVDEILNYPKQYPMFDYPQFTSEKLKEKYEYNNDVVGWLTVPGTDIDEEVLQSTDNDFYLRRTIDKQNNVWGCYFVDYKCNVKSREDLSRVTIIYGHSLKDYSDGKKFTQLKRYNNIDFCKENSIITFSLLYEELRFQIFSISIMPIDFYYIDADPTDERFGEVISKIYENSVHFFSKIKIQKDDHILFLQTCTSDKNHRFIVAAKLIEN